jgi:hypothetical protein
MSRWKQAEDQNVQLASRCSARACLVRHTLSAKAYAAKFAYCAHGKRTGEYIFRVEQGSAPCTPVCMCNDDASVRQGNEAV